eukprot:CAMPEP_0174257412 /NCGR_PEP_ID=MMETSP0439-20130205/6548_1 /TAXON_ID=0 /ORGANISM="Stereomyxa ramosa, Strain Chinc5" /LENGTH=1170 /DNA_ID=CAMNT_0015340483 /DNA_START=326 /DNA_END=3838 /DNA_ORIENTATION=-
MNKEFRFASSEDLSTHLIDTSGDVKLPVLRRSNTVDSKCSKSQKQWKGGSSSPKRRHDVAFECDSKPQKQVSRSPSPKRRHDVALSCESPTQGKSPKGQGLSQSLSYTSSRDRERVTSFQNRKKKSKFGWSKNNKPLGEVVPQPEKDRKRSTTSARLKSKLRGKQLPTFQLFAPRPGKLSEHGYDQKKLERISSQYGLIISDELFEQQMASESRVPLYKLPDEAVEDCLDMLPPALVDFYYYPLRVQIGEFQNHRESGYRMKQRLSASQGKGKTKKIIGTNKALDSLFKKRKKSASVQMRRSKNDFLKRKVSAEMRPSKSMCDKDLRLKRKTSADLKSTSSSWVNDSTQPIWERDDAVLSSSGSREDSVDFSSVDKYVVYGPDEQETEVQIDWPEEQEESGLGMGFDSNNNVATNPNPLHSLYGPDHPNNNNPYYPSHTSSGSSTTKHKFVYQKKIAEDSSTSNCEGFNSEDGSGAEDSAFSSGEYAGGDNAACPNPGDNTGMQNVSGSTYILSFGDDGDNSSDDDELETTGYSSDFTDCRDNPNLNPNHNPNPNTTKTNSGYSSNNNCGVDEYENNPHNGGVDSAGYSSPVNNDNNDNNRANYNDKPSTANYSTDVGLEKSTQPVSPLKISQQNIKNTDTNSEESGAQSDSNNRPKDSDNNNNHNNNSSPFKTSGNDHNNSNNNSNSKVGAKGSGRINSSDGLRSGASNTNNRNLRRSRESDNNNNSSVVVNPNLKDLKSGASSKRRRKGSSVILNILLHPPDSSKTDHHADRKAKFKRISPRVVARSISTYPRFLSDPGMRQGDPICDYFKIHTYQNGLVFCVCDGCGWGWSSATASKSVSDTFTEFLECVTELRETDDMVQEIQPRSVAQLFKYLLKGLAKSHNAIFQGKESWECGTTTVVAGAVVSLSDTIQSPDTQHFDRALALVCVGDCKVYLYQRDSVTFTEVTYGNREDSTGTDPGGRLGPQIAEMEGLPPTLPDLRNLRSLFTPCNQGDIVIVVSDGIHDNIDPEKMGVTPDQIDSKYSSSWDSLELATKLELKNRFTMDLFHHIFFNKPKASSLTSFSFKELQEELNKSIESIVAEQQDGWDDSHLQRDYYTPEFLLESNYCEESELTPLIATRNLIQHAVRTTLPIRHFMEVHPDQRQPKNSRMFPGKMDHTTCVSFCV